MPNLRQEDREEWAAGGWVPMEPYLGYAIEMAKLEAIKCFVRIASLGDEPMLLYGVMPHNELTNVGVVWMIAHEDAPKHALRLHKECMGEVDEMLSLYPTLHADVYQENAEHLRWLHMLGFQANLPYKREPFGAWFIPMERRA